MVDKASDHGAFYFLVLTFELIQPACDPLGFTSGFIG